MSGVFRRGGVGLPNMPAGMVGLICLLLFLPPMVSAREKAERFALSPQQEFFHIAMPSSIYAGEAALVVVTAPRAPAVTLIWLDKEFTVPAVPDQEDLYFRALLPVPLEEKRPHLVLRVRASGYRAVERSVAVLQKTRPMQKLNVAPAHVDPPASVRARIASEAQRTKEILGRITPRRMWRLPLERPIPGSVSSAFGLRRVFNGQPRSPHKGLDLRGAEGVPVCAPSDGTVALADDLYFSGKVVYLDHGLGVFSLYAHLSAVNVEEGQKVVRGQMIGRVGATGRATGPHLHFGCYVFGTAVDPEPLTEK